MAEIKTIKKNIYPFDDEIARVEAKNAEKLFLLHLSRCDSAESAGFLAGIFENLAGKFKQKTLALTEKV